jgi:anthranilate phosphoribosyltransferase
LAGFFVSSLPSRIIAMYLTDILADARLRPERDTPEHLLARLCSGESLTSLETESLFAELVAGRLDETQIAALLIALKVKGETEAELIGAARALRAAALPFDRPDYMFADTCGTGGDGAGTVNLSTAVAFVVAAAGLPVVKHGNRSVTSRCGSSDVLDHLGVRIDCAPELSRQALDEAGLCFLFAPQYHPGLRHAAPVRRALKMRTVMNLLGPCVNPARPPVQLLGVPDPALVEPIARTLAALGVERALVVHGSGLDEIALHGDTVAARLDAGTITPLRITPEDAGLARVPLAALKGGSPEENAQRLSALLLGYGTTAEVSAVALNAGALLMVAGRAASLKDGVDIARQLLASGEPHRRLMALREITHA